MANNLKVGDTVYVPTSKINPPVKDLDTALYRTKVVDLQGNSATVNLPDGVVSQPLGVSLLHTSVGIMLIEIGDFATEATTLDPLAKSVLQFCRLLVPDDQLRFIKVRSLAELERFWSDNHGAYSHVILVGHGDENLLAFGVDGDVNVDELCKRFDVKNASQKIFVSLACKTGFKGFGGEFSKSKVCKSFIGPFQSIHGAIGSQFCQTFLAAHLLEGKTTKVAFKLARSCVPDGTSFKLWSGGSLAKIPVKKSAPAKTPAAKTIAAKTTAAKTTAGKTTAGKTAAGKTASAKTPAAKTTAAKTAAAKKAVP